jgi:hypothetical protein
MKKDIVVISKVMSNYERGLITESEFYTHILEIAVKGLNELPKLGINEGIAR